MSLSATLTLSFDGQFSRDDRIATVVDTVRTSGGWSEPKLTFSDESGSADAIASDWYRNQLSLAAGGTLDFDLNGPSRYDPLNLPLAFSTIHYVLAQIVDPTSTKKLRIGPQGLPTAWKGPFGGVGDLNYLEFSRWWEVVDPAGWSVTPGAADILRIVNPTGAAITFNLLIVGTRNTTGPGGSPGMTLEPPVSL